MLSARQLKFLTALRHKKFRQKYRMFVLEGAKLVAELLQQQRVRPHAVYATEAWAAAHCELVERAGERFQLISEKDLRKISALTTPPGVLAVAEQPSVSTVERGPAFYADGLRDPGNMGTLLRIADWFGFVGVYCSPDSADLFSPKVVQASMGAILRIPVAEISLKALLPMRGETPVVGATLDGENVLKMNIPTNALFVIGSESEGIRPATERYLTHRITIPRAPESRAESLNAAVAAGILAAFCSAGRDKS